MSVCETDWSNVFDPLFQAVVDSAPLPCSYIVPEPPRGETLDLDRVNLQWTPTSGAPVIIPRAPSDASCGADAAWFLDAGQTTVELCPLTCNQLRADGGRVDLAFGCEAVLLI